MRCQRRRLGSSPDLQRLFQELSSYSAPPAHDDAMEVSDGLYVPFRLATTDGAELNFVSTIATFGSPLDVCVENLAMESFFPAEQRHRGLSAWARRRPPGRPGRTASCIASVCRVAVIIIFLSL
jgi:hypothetical protein